jgi:hypothetical protein
MIISPERPEIFEDVSVSIWLVILRVNQLSHAILSEKIYFSHASLLRLLAFRKLQKSFPAILPDYDKL